MCVAIVDLRKDSPEKNHVQRGDADMAGGAIGHTLEDLYADARDPTPVVTVTSKLICAP